MPSRLYISDPFTKSRNALEGIDFENEVSYLKGMIENQTGMLSANQELIYFGECLEEDNRSISSYGIKPNATIFVNEKVKVPEELATPSVTEEEVQALLNKLRNPMYRISVRKLLKDKTKIEKMIASIKTNGHFAKIILSDTDLLLSIIETATAASIRKTHPNIVEVFKQIISNTSSTSSRAALFSNDDGDDGSYDGIDPALLAQAELLASGEENLQQQRQQQASSSSSSRPIRTQFSASDLASALSFVTTQTPAEVERSQPTEEDRQLDASLDALRAVGITDDDLSRRALTISSGNIEAAINLIFEGTIS